MTFFNFWNPQTFHFFQWVMYSGKVPADSLIARAFEKIETGEDDVADGKFWHEAGVDTYHCLRDELAGIVQDVLENAAERFFSPHDPLFCAGDEGGFENFSEPGELAGLSEDFLFLPMLIQAMREIDHGAVAEAILRAKGKWIPDSTPPRVEPGPIDDDDESPQTA
jgi:hypothetical protein